MATKTTPAAGLRRCRGSATFGIAAHEAPVADFPVQPSRKDGLGTMCKPHWREYTRALGQARQARKADPLVAALDPAEPKRRKSSAKAAPGRVTKAKALVDAIDALPGPEYVDAIGSDEAQAALETLAAPRDAMVLVAGRDGLAHLD